MLPSIGEATKGRARPHRLFGASLIQWAQHGSRIAAALLAVACAARAVGLFHESDGRGPMGSPFTWMAGALLLFGFVNYGRPLDRPWSEGREWASKPPW